MEGGAAIWAYFIARLYIGESIVLSRISNIEAKLVAKIPEISRAKIIRIQFC